MTTQTQTLADFLLARFAERERRVNEIPDWYCTDSARGEGWGSRGDCPLCLRYMSDGTESVTAEAFWEHMDDVHERAFVLAECEAKRRIVGAHREQVEKDDDGAWIVASGVLLKALSLPYADHPDFREEWRP